jgi:Ca2+-binding RTX toxin-like protein
MFVPETESLAQRIVPAWSASFNNSTGVISISVTDDMVTLRIDSVGSITANHQLITDGGGNYATVTNTTKIEGVCGGGQQAMVDAIDAAQLGHGTWGFNKPCYFTGGSGFDSLVGGPGDDEISGNAHGDRLDGSAGKDTLTGGTGDDSLVGNDGNDELWGQAGNDTLVGANGQDSLLGGIDNDSLFGGAHKETLAGDSGNDLLFGEGGDDKLIGVDGTDLLDGGTENDTLLGGNQDDNLDGGPGSDSLDGGSGSDWLWAADGEVDYALFGGTGSDIFTLDFLGFDDGALIDFNPSEDQFFYA